MLAGGISSKSERSTLPLIVGRLLAWLAGCGLLQNSMMVIISRGIKSLPMLKCSEGERCV
jgi:hypothetical protein